LGFRALGLGLVALSFAALVAAAAISARVSRSRTVAAAGAPAQIILDTDIGDDIDDAFALGLALHSPEVKVVGITTAWGDTALRARLVNRLLRETHRAGIPVAVGIATKSKVPFTQARWALGGAASARRVDAVDFLLRAIRENPEEITLVAIAPLTNLGAAIDRDPATFRKLKRVVLMGGSIRRGYDGPDGRAANAPSAEYNIASDVSAAKKLFASGVPIFMMPLDSTQLRMDAANRASLSRAGTPLAGALTALYRQWGQQTPTLYDAMAVAYVAEPGLCPVTAMRVDVDGRGFTRARAGAGAGAANVSACLASDPARFFRFLMPRLAGAGGK
jgi:inosine-uridine nucleoside N-ribohydrolase